MNARRLTAVALSFALVGALAACGDPVAASTQAATSTSTSNGVADDAPEPTHTVADTVFAQLMTVHHQDAIEIAALAEMNAGSQEVKDVALAVADEQQPQIDTMTWWLEAWGEPSAARAAANGLMHTGMQMDGLSHSEAMVELAGLVGAEFDRRFLEITVSHHEGAILIAQEEIDGGVNADAITLAESILVSQTAEIAVLQAMIIPA